MFVSKGMKDLQLRHGMATGISRQRSASFSMRRWLAGILVIMAAAAVGCSESKACAPVKDGVGVCVDGQPIAWAAGGPTPHMHEPAGYYAPVAELARALGVQPEIAADRRSVRVGGKAVVVRSDGAKGIHQHEDRVFAPIREFAEAAGFRADVDTAKHTINIHK